MELYLGAASAICPLGNTLEGIFKEMALGNTGIKKMPDAFGLGKEEFAGIIPDELITEKESTRLRGMLCTSINSTINGLKDSATINAESTRVILCTTKGEIDKLETEGAEAAQLYNLSTFLQNKYSLAYRPIVISSACVSGLLGVINAAKMIRSGIAENVLVIGADLVTKFTLSGFISFYATATTPSKPYDKNRDGINLGEAAASVVISSNADIYKDVLGKYLGGASANDANHISGPSRTGEGLYRSINSAFEESKLSADEIDFISAHGTATAFNDEMEAIAFNRLEMNNVPLNSMKGYFGHTLGAAGLLESLIGLQSLKSKLLLKSYGFENAGVSKPIKVLTENQKGRFKTMLKTSSGFGGSNAAAIFEVV